MRKPVVLVTGANGEIGHALIAHLTARGRTPVVALDVNALDRALAHLVLREFTGSTLDRSLLERILAEFEVDRVFHLAALLSTRSEFTPGCTNRSTGASRRRSATRSSGRGMRSPGRREQTCVSFVRPTVPGTPASTESRAG